MVKWDFLIMEGALINALYNVADSNNLATLIKI